MTQIFNLNYISIYIPSHFTITEYLLWDKDIKFTPTLRTRKLTHFLIGGKKSPKGPLPYVVGRMCVVVLYLVKVGAYYPYVVLGYVVVHVRKKNVKFLSR